MKFLTWVTSQLYGHKRWNIWKTFILSVYRFSLKEVIFINSPRKFELDENCQYVESCYVFIINTIHDSIKSYVNMNKNPLNTSALWYKFSPWQYTISIRICSSNATWIQHYSLFQAAIFAVNKLFQTENIECPVFVSIQ